MELLLVLAGGLIGLAGGLGTVLLSHKLQAADARRNQLREAYAAWGGDILLAVESVSTLAMYDHIEHVKKRHMELASMPSSPSGKTREEHVRDWRQTVARVKTSEARLLLIEADDKLVARVRVLSDGSPADVGGSDDVGRLVSFRRDQEDAIVNFLRTVHREHPRLSRSGRTG